uniref:Uncharacterized protein n=1 Tax=Anopheles melas TaxID=34690 RepID=A0A182U6Z2_9DIPT
MTVHVGLEGGPHAEFELTPIVSIGIFIGILTVLICIIIAVAAAFKLRATQAKQHTTATTTTAGGKRPGNLPIKEKISLPLSQSEDMYDEKNPDVVPSNEDPDYKLISANQTPTALHNSLCNSKHDIIGRTILDDSRKTYLTGLSRNADSVRLRAWNVTLAAILGVGLGPGSETARTNAPHRPLMHGENKAAPARPRRNAANQKHRHARQHKANNNIPTGGPSWKAMHGNALLQ